MTTPTCWRPATGADSVPYPAELLAESVDHDSPQAQAAYARYLIDCQEAANRETADEAIVRCRAEADHFEGGAARFELVLDTLTDALDRHVADLTGPDGEQWRGFSLEESSCYGSGQVDKLARSYAAMAKAWDALDRAAFRKAAAEFSTTLADLAIGMVVKQEGGAA